MDRILIIEDDQALLPGMVDAFKEEHLLVTTQTDGKKGYDTALNEEFDIIILDLNLPSMNGFDICKELRKNSIKIPIIMLTAKQEEVDKIIGFEIGADDYVTKPFSLRELIARVKAHLRRNKGEISPVDFFEFDDIKINFKTYETFKGEKLIELTSTEYAILKYLIEHKDEAVRRIDLIGLIWGSDKYGATRTIDNHVVKLRKELEENPANPKHILTVRGVGYRFV